MAKTKVEPLSQIDIPRPATTIEARENQLINAAINLAEQRILNGTATAQEICHFLKLGSTSAIMEKRLAEKQEQLMQAKIDNLESERRQEEMYAQALHAMTMYRGFGEEEEYYDNPTVPGQY